MRDQTYRILLLPTESLTPIEGPPFACIQLYQNLSLGLASWKVFRRAVFDARYAQYEQCIAKHKSFNGDKVGQWEGKEDVEF